MLQPTDDEEVVGGSYQRSTAKLLNLDRVLIQGMLTLTPARRIDLVQGYLQDLWHVHNYVEYSGRLSTRSHHLSPDAPISFFHFVFTVK